MTKEEIGYWGAPPYTVVLEDNKGHPEAIVYTDGTIVPVGTSNVGRTHIDKGTAMEVVWDGSMPDPSRGCHTKGRLLPVQGPPYVDSLRVFYRLVKGGNYGEEPTEETPGRGAVKTTTRKAKGNRPKGQPKTKGTR
jgi:hypothetical protein